MPKNPHADFTPTLAGYSGISPFRFWCQTALPLTYDDSLSYYELLNKVVNYLNHTIEDLTNVENNTSELAEAYEQLQKYVNDYFDDIDIEAELRNVLDKMAEDGTLDALLDPLVKNQLPGVVDEKIDGVVASQIDEAVAGQIDESVGDQLPALVDAGIPGKVSDWLDKNVEPVGSAVLVDTTLSISGAAADAKVTGDAIRELNETATSLTNAVFGDITRNFTPNKNLDENGEEVNDNTSSVSEFIPYSWTGNARFYCSENGSAKYAYKIAFYDANKVKLNVFPYPATDGTAYRNINAETQVTGTAAFVKFSFEKNFEGKITNSANPPTADYWVSNEVYHGLVEATENNTLKINEVEANTNDNTENIEDINVVLNGETVQNFTPNKNLNADGEEIDDNTSTVSEFIPYTWTGYAKFYCSEGGSNKYAYKIAFYDADKVKLNAFGYPASDGGTNRAIDAKTQVSGTPAFVKFSFEKNFTGKITDQSNPPKIEYWITEEVHTAGLTEIVTANRDVSAKTKLLLGADSISFETQSLTANTALKLDNAPWFIMKNQGISARVKFSTFTSLAVGKGYMNYRGRWVLIDDTYVHIYGTKEDDTYPGNAVQYDYKAHPEYIKQNGEWIENPAYEGASTHALAISDFIEVSMFETVDGKIRTNIDTTSGSFSVDIESLYRWNYAPFILGGQAMSDVKIGYSCSDIRSPLWMFGDSYLGIAINRIGGQLRNFGFTSYLMDSIAGGRAVDSGNPGKSISDDLNKLLSMGTPKYIVWTLGMNGTIQMNTDYIEELKAICVEKGITLILYMPPSIPENDKTTLNEYIAETGLRYINAYDAVGANAQGVWYSGFLSNDNVHPSTNGAKAIAMRFLADVPELMQYGYSTGNVDTENDDNDET